MKVTLFIIELISYAHIVIRICIYFLSEKQLVHVVVDPVLSKVLRPHQREVRV